MEKEEQLSTGSSDNTKNDTQNEQSNPLRVNDTEAWLGKSIIIVGAPPPQKLIGDNRYQRGKHGNPCNG